jgi:hypothetical protein
MTNKEKLQQLTSEYPDVLFYIDDTDDNIEIGELHGPLFCPVSPGNPPTPVVDLAALWGRPKSTK